MPGLGHVFALLALDEADRADRAAGRARQTVSSREAEDEGLDAHRAEARASAWRRWIARREAADLPVPATAPRPRRASHV